MADALSLRISPSPYQSYILNNPTIKYFGMSSSTIKFGTVFQAQDTNAITHLGVLPSLRQGTPPTYRISLQGVDATTGYPDGTIKGGGSPASGTFTPPSAGSTWDGNFQWIALTNSYTPARGEVLALVVDYSSGTINGSNFTYFSDWLQVINYQQLAFPYAVNYNGASWARSSQEFPCFGVRSASTRYGFVVGGNSGSLQNATDVSTVGHRQALKFNIPSTWFTSFTVKGFRWNGKIASAAGKNPIAGLWTSSTTLQNVTLDSDLGYNPTTDTTTHEYYFDETTLSTLSPGTDYYVGLEVADASSGGLRLKAYQMSETNDSLCYPLGTNACFASYNGTTWTADGTLRPCMELILGDITSSGGGSGGLMYRRTLDGGIA